MMVWPQAQEGRGGPEFSASAPGLTSVAGLEPGSWEPGTEESDCSSDAWAPETATLHPMAAWLCGPWSNLDGF